jgi:hypothetical protein
MLDLVRIPPPRFPDVRFRTPANWTAVVFFASLGAVHLAIAASATLHGRWEGSLGLFFGIVFLSAAFFARQFRIETMISPSRRQIRLRTGTRRWHSERFISFDEVSAIRLTIVGVTDEESLIEILCREETLPCQPTPIPSQQALFFAMMLEVPLVKVSECEEAPGPAEHMNVPVPHPEPGELQE